MVGSIGASDDDDILAMPVFFVLSPIHVAGANGGSDGISGVHVLFTRNSVSRNDPGLIDFWVGRSFDDFTFDWVEGPYHDGDILRGAGHLETRALNESQGGESFAVLKAEAVGSCQLGGLGMGAQS